MGCIARLGCLIVLAILACVGWFTRDLWLPGRFRTHPAVVASGHWQPASDVGAERARAALERLSQPRGPVFETLPAGDLASLGADELAKRIGGSPDSVAARVDGDRLSVRARVDFTTMRGKFGPLASMFGDREMVQLTGHLPYAQARPRRV